MPSSINLHARPDSSKISANARMGDHGSDVLTDCGYGRFYLSLRINLGGDDVTLFTVDESQGDRLCDALEAACREWRKQRAAGKVA